jgi:hypothetical protein
MPKRISGASGRQYEVGDVELTEQEQALVEWAAGDVRPAGRRPNARRGSAAAEHGRAVLEAVLGSAATVDKAMGGRPPLDPSARRGQHAPVRQVRLPVSMNEQLTELAAAEGRKPSEIIREALAAYLNAHRAS